MTTRDKIEKMWGLKHRWFDSGLQLNEMEREALLSKIFNLMFEVMDELETRPGCRCGPLQ